MNIKRISAILLALILTLCLIPTAFADVIFEPRDSFYEKHREDMYYADKVYIAQETANGYESPKDDDVVLTASDGTRLYISFVYTDANGVEWGVYDPDTTTCWFRLSDLVAEYDTRDFINDHKHEFTDYNDQLADLPLDGGEMPLWTYPGSSVESGWIYLDGDFNPADYAFYVYTDFEGREWVYFPYVYGMNGWANAADPMNDEPVVFDVNIPAEPEETPAPTEEPAAENTVEPLPTVEPVKAVDDVITGGHPTGFGNILVIVIVLLAVGFVVVLSVVLIVVFYVLGKNKKK